MKTRLALLVAGLAIVLIAAGCARQGATKAGRVYVVRVADDGTVRPDPVTLNSANNDRVVWVSDAHAGFDVHFDEPSPFGNNATDYDLPPGQSVDPGSVTKKTDHTYQYRLVPKTSGKTGAAGDPTIIITGGAGT